MKVELFSSLIEEGKLSYGDSKPSPCRKLKTRQGKRYRAPVALTRSNRRPLTRHENVLNGIGRIQAPLPRDSRAPREEDESAGGGDKWGLALENNGWPVTSVKKQAKQKPPAFRVNKRDEIEKYRSSYPVLYEELKYSYRFPRKPFRILDLPTEIRFRIYEFALVFDEPIEIWPETGDPRHGNRKAMYKNFRALKRNHSQWGRNVKLLRTCMLIHAEAGEVYYGNNAFRFSAMNGWMVANAFLYHIGHGHYKHITSLTVPLPFEYWTTTGVFKCIDSKSSLQKFIGMIPFKCPPDLDYGQSFYDVCLAMKKLGKLRTLNLVLPDWYELFRISFNPSPQLANALDQNALEALRTKGFTECRMIDAIMALKATCGDKLTISIVRLLPSFGPNYKLDSALEAAHTKFVKDCAAELGWKTKYATYSWGAFKVVDEEELGKFGDGDDGGEVSGAAGVQWYIGGLVGKD
ncbi:hypothetical protein BCR34DRAFT_590629 [Clohesyomyces aquaticus]|uniref:Uncharacterized protein n=1 Tax=Clohesyomyces aquaticus TaxID=1231657 RepID=A0A1Y1Z7Z3_9PLEO|nr:hypothetical protein BCR34DRAFT_590629 [Clohesyomyces aquaticus]